MLTARNLLVGPVAAIGERGRLRLVQCRTSDPVSHALARGATRASFPNIGGWCVRDWAARAVAEQRAHLELGEQTRLPPWVDAPLDRGVTALSAMFGAARAALFAESVASGQPELPLTAAAVAAALGERYADARMVAECAYDALAAARLHRRGVDPRITSALRGVVDALPSYRPGTAPPPPAMPQPFPRSPRPS
jgi:hypothetical protein